MKKLKGQVVVVTGASSGIGRAAALAFADQGAVVVAVARRDEPVAEVAEECRARAGDAMAVPADVADAAAVDQVARQVVGRHGRVDVWVNNAAVHLFGPVEDVPVEDWHRVVETNLFGTYHGIRAALPWMREQGSGVIVNVASILAKVAAPQQSAYVASKHAIRGLSDTVRQEVDDVADLHVCTVLPGPIDTPLFQRAANHSGHEVIPLTPVIDAHRVADAIVSCARKPRREVVVGVPVTGLSGLTRLLPGGVERLTAKVVERDHFGDRLAPPTDGNLFEPDDADTISGGWSRGGKQVGPDSRRAASSDGGGLTRKASLVGAVSAAVALGASALRRR